MGKLVCYAQNQVDQLFSSLKKDTGSPDAALIAQMGTVAGE